jgi:DNA repair protein RadD
VKLRAHQTRALEALRRCTSDRRLLVAPTGFGKTVVICEVARRHLGLGGTGVLIVVHRRELVRQTVAKLRAAGLGVAVLAGDAERGDAASKVVVASVQTLVSRGDRPASSLVVWDEAHHVVAESFRMVAGDYPEALHVGFTATPQRSDGQALGDMFEELVVGATVRELTSGGWLAPCDVVAPVREVEGLAADPIEAWKVWGGGRPCVVFCGSVAHAKAVAEAGGGVAVDGEMDGAARDAALAAFARGDVNLITNVFCLTEGWDCPRASVAVLARGCGYTGPFLQMVGRVLRPSPGKDRALLIDLVGAVNVLGLPDEDRVWSLTGDACRRSERLDAMARCLECLAVFRPAKVCPRCDAARQVIARVPRVLTRGERLQRLSGVPQTERDRRYFGSLLRVAVQRIRLSGASAEQWAVRRFYKQFGRMPEVG